MLSFKHFHIKAVKKNTLSLGIILQDRERESKAGNDAITSEEKWQLYFLSQKNYYVQTTII